MAKGKNIENAPSDLNSALEKGLKLNFILFINLGSTNEAGAGLPSYEGSILLHGG